MRLCTNQLWSVLSSYYRRTAFGFFTYRYPDIRLERNVTGRNAPPRLSFGELRELSAQQDSADKEVDRTEDGIPSKILRM